MTDTEADSLFELVNQMWLTPSQDRLVPALKLALDEVGHPAASQIDLYGTAADNYPVIIRLYKEIAACRYMRGGDVSPTPRKKTCSNWSTRR